MLVCAGYDRHHNCSDICEHCPAKTSGCTDYADLRATASYSRVVFDHDCYLHNVPVREQSPWCTIPGWDIRLHRDCMQHVLYNGGVASDFTAGAFKFCIMSGLYGQGTLEQQVQCLHDTFVVSHSGSIDDHDAKPFTARRLGILTETSPPSFGLSYKHGHIKAFVHFCAEQCALIQPQTPVSQLIYKAAAAFSSWIRFLENCKPVLQNWQREFAYQKGREFLDPYSILIALDRHDRTLPNYRPLFRARPKVHVLWHQIEHLKSSSCNILLNWSCWQEEDFMGRVARIFKRCHPRTGALRTLQRYLLFLHADLLADSAR